MGSIQSLKSEALAIRAKEDTSLQISTYLGGVNKSLGSQVTSMIDQLQGVINQRTKAYNGLIGKVNKAMNGAGGIGEVAIKLTFSYVQTIISVIAIAKGDSASLSDAIKIFTQVATAIISTASATHQMKQIAWDYEKAVSQLGYSSVGPSNPSDFGNPDGFTFVGAVNSVKLRDGLMPRYKAHEISLSSAQSGYDKARGYVGTLRRI